MSLQQKFPPSLRKRLRRLLRPAWMGTLRRLTPLSDYWGMERGTPVDRYYIEQFLNQHRRDIRGRVLEVRDSAYTDRFGTTVERCDILDIEANNPRATLVADLTAPTGIPSDQFDCFILTQTLQFIYDFRSAAGQAFRLLRPGGVLLATVPSISRIDPHHFPNDYWRFSAAACRELFGAQFGHGSVTVQSYGNVLTSLAFLTGMAREELGQAELETHDAYFPIIVAVRAVKPAGVVDQT